MSADPDDELWAAIADPSRRRVLDLLVQRGEASASSLAGQVPFSRQAVSKHLVVLDRVGLIHAAPAGRERHYRVDETQLARAVAQLSAVGSAWDTRLRRIKTIAEKLASSPDSSPSSSPKED
jgi:DNA-binding transcriptional ArsR family regulator